MSYADELLEAPLAARKFLPGGRVGVHAFLPASGAAG